MLAFQHGAPEGADRRFEERGRRRQYLEQPDLARAADRVVTELGLDLRLREHQAVVDVRALRFGEEHVREFLECLDRRPRSEEHTSELQSLAYLVCRLLLEKKKKNFIE